MSYLSDTLCRKSVSLLCSRIQQVFALDAVMVLNHKITCVVTLAASCLCLYFTLSLLISL